MSENDASENDASDNDAGQDPGDEFGLDAGRSIELHASGASWAGRWDRLTSELAAYRC